MRAQLSVHKDLQRQREGIRSALNNTSTSTVHNNHRHNHRRVVFLDSNQENDSQYDEQISNTTALPAPFPFLRPGNQKASKQVRSRVQPKSKKPNQNFTATSAHAVLWIRTTKTCIASAKTVCRTAVPLAAPPRPPPLTQATRPHRERQRALALRLEKAHSKQNPHLSRLNEKQKANCTKNELC